MFVYVYSTSEVTCTPLMGLVFCEVQVRQHMHWRVKGVLAGRLRHLIPIKIEMDQKRRIMRLRQTKKFYPCFTVRYVVPIEPLSQISPQPDHWVQFLVTQTYCADLLLLPLGCVHKGKTSHTILIHSAIQTTSQSPCFLTNRSLRYIDTCFPSSGPPRSNPLTFKLP